MLPEAVPGNVVGHAAVHGKVAMALRYTLVAGDWRSISVLDAQYQPPTYAPASLECHAPPGAMIPAAGPNPDGSVSTP
jgi:hypothetical protein